MSRKIIKKIRLEYLVIFLVVLLSLFLRLFKISSYMTFLGDEGRDTLVWLRMLHGKFTLIGPMTSIGNMYLGPLYYYLMLPFYILMGTVGPSVGVALFAGATTFMLWFFGKEWFSERVGWVAALLYSISPVAIVLSRSSWNPNVMPFFSLLTIWGIWQFWQKNKYYWLAIEGVLLSFAIQSHYLGILLIPVVGLFFIIKLTYLIKGKNKNTDEFLINFVLCTLIFALLTIAPLVWFDLRHNFINYKAFYKFFSERQTTVNLKPYKAIPEMWPLWKTLVIRLIAGKNEFIGFWLSLVTSIAIIVGIIQGAFISIHRSIDINVKRLKPRFLIFVWLIIGLLGMGLYKQHIYDHYFGFLFPAIFLFFSFILDWLWRNRFYFKVSAAILFVIVVFLSLSENPFKYSPNFQTKRTKEISEKIIKESGGKPFNLGLIAKQNYDAGYRYFLEKAGKKAVEIDPQLAGETITKQLFVVCEEMVCQPASHPQAEIANFGWSKIEEQWDYPWGTKLFKLTHYPK